MPELHALRFPESVLIDLVNTCNYSCRFCWYHFDPRVQFLRTFKGVPYHFPAEVVKRVLHELSGLNRRVNVTFTSEGEPTLHPQLGSILDEAVSCGLDAGVQTNGTFPVRLRPAISRVARVDCNISALTKRTFTALNPKSKNLTATAISNIRYLSGLSRHPVLTLVFIVTRQNLSDLVRLPEFCNRLGVDKVFLKLCEIVYPYNKELMLSKKDAIGVARLLTQQRDRCRFTHNFDEVVKDILFGYRGEEEFKDNPVLHDLDFCWKEWKTKASRIPWCESDYVYRTPGIKACTNPLRYLYLRLDGSVYTCPRNSWIDPVGNVFDSTLPQILKGDKYRAFVKDALFSFDIAEPRWRRCKNCPFEKDHLRVMEHLRRHAPGVLRRMLCRK
jgi:MoaA/NifB/PqqE/SkfB family radical SAM enzyme